MSEEAGTCPNCHKPRLVGNIKSCPKCGEVMEARKRKCPKCESSQYTNNPPLSNKSGMVKANTGNSFNVLPLIVGMVLGATIMLAYFTYFLESESNVEIANPQTEIPQSTASVNQIDGIYVFINSDPARPTKSLGTFNYESGNKLLDIFNSKGDNPLDEINVIANMLVFDKKLNSVIEEVKQQYPEAECVVFSGRLDRCEVYKFR